MDSLYDVTQAINSAKDVDELVKYYEKYLIEFLGIEDLVLYFYNSEWAVKTFICTHIENCHDIDVPIALKYKEPSKLNPEDSKKIGGYKYVLPVYYNDVVLSFALLGDVKYQNVESEHYLIQYAQVLTNIISMAIENKRLLIRELEKKEFDKEMELASKIQGMIIPKRLPKNHIYEFAGLYMPHRSIGGDYYDVINVNKDEFVFCMGDISGKGIAAALVMANLQSYLNASPPLVTESERELVDRLNSKILSITNGEKFITLFIARYNILTKELVYLNAGHNPPFLVNQGEVTRLDKGCALLGILDYIPKVQIGRLILEPDSMIFTYTDGLSEMENQNGIAYGDERLKKFAAKNGHLSSESFVKKLYSDLNTYNEQNGFNDDVSVLVGKFY
ncbi:MAG TPA: PP2C family protein-serine/threonine phosphatase [Chitinophagales bacterium]|nr:PP2C family protein-serine/threonine phosphatase [Chitinophagales bacterium]